MKTIIYCTRFFLLLTLVSLFTACAQRNNADTKSQLSKKTSSLHKTSEEWKKTLTDEQYRVLREGETEKPFSGKLLYNKEKGLYKCAGCGNELFTDQMKFDSHCGWPSFDQEIGGGKIIKKEDHSHGMHRTEIICAKCEGHLGHLFDDGPTPTGMRYCVNSASLVFEKDNNTKKNVSSNLDTITLGGGCYWCVEAVYEMLDGVQLVTSGFSGGITSNPSYYDVCKGNTGHAEVVEIVFDPSRTNIDEILKVFFTVHDPTTLNRQGADEGTQYRSVIFYRGNAQYQIARSLINELDQSKVYESPIVTELAPFKAFYPAENEHQDFYAQNSNKPYCKMVIQPKLEKFEKVFKDRLKKQQ